MSVEVVVGPSVEVSVSNPVEVNVPVGWDKWLEHKVTFAGTEFLILNELDNNYLELTWTFHLGDGYCQFRCVNIASFYEVEIYRLYDQNQTTEVITATNEPALITIEANGSEFNESTWMIRVPRISTNIFR